jgi:hypothetical protein
MVVTLTDGSRLELRAMPRFREVERYILDKSSPAVRTASAAKV